MPSVGAVLVSKRPTSIVPLCRVHHVELHRTHRAVFEAEHQVDPMEVAYNLLHRYLTGAWVTMVLDDRRPDQMHG